MRSEMDRGVGRRQPKDRIRGDRVLAKGRFAELDGVLLHGRRRAVADFIFAFGQCLDFRDDRHGTFRCGDRVKRRRRLQRETRRALASGFVEMIGNQPESARRGQGVQSRNARLRLSQVEARSFAAQLAEKFLELESRWIQRFDLRGEAG